MREPLPLATIQTAILDFLRGRDHVVIFGAQAVNAYVAEPRMTQDIDLLSTEADDLAESLKGYLSQAFHIAVRIRRVSGGRGLRLYQVRKSGNRHLVDIRAVDKLPKARSIDQLQVMAPAELIASKVIAYTQRRGRPKSGTDWRDIALLLLTFPELKQAEGLVQQHLQTGSNPPETLAIWQEFVAMSIEPEDDDF